MNIRDLQEGPDFEDMRKDPRLEELFSVNNEQ